MGIIKDLGPDMGRVGRREKHERSAATLESVRYVLGASASTITRVTSASRNLGESGCCLHFINTYCSVDVSALSHYRISDLCHLSSSLSREKPFQATFQGRES